MPSWYLCSNEEGLHSCKTWLEAKGLTHGHANSWVKRFTTKAELLAAQRETLVTCAVGLADAPPEDAVACFEGAVSSDQARSAAAVYFSPGDPRNEVLLLAPAEGPHSVPRAELQGLLLCLRKGVADGALLSSSAFICKAFARGWPAHYAHQDLMAEVRSRWPPTLRIVKAPRSLDAVLRTALAAAVSCAAAETRRGPCTRPGPLASACDSPSPASP